jgi:hypothetical protein
VSSSNSCPVVLLFSASATRRFAASKACPRTSSCKNESACPLSAFVCAFSAALIRFCANSTALLFLVHVACACLRAVSASYTSSLAFMYWSLASCFRISAAFRFVSCSSFSVAWSPSGFPSGGLFASSSSGGLASSLSGGFAGGFPSPPGGYWSPACSPGGSFSSPSGGLA